MTRNQMIIELRQIREARDRGGHGRDVARRLRRREAVLVRRLAGDDPRFAQVGARRGRLETIDQRHVAHRRAVRRIFQVLGNV